MVAELSESDFMRQFTDLAEMNGWRWLHIERMGNDRGQWRTPVSGPLGRGFPDLMLFKPATGRLLFVELKAQRGVLTADQKERLNELRAIGETYVFRPSDWPAIVEMLHYA